MITRKQYLQDSSNLHRQYFGQFVNEGVKQKVLSHFTVEDLKQSLAQDDHFNSNITPLKTWDLMGGFVWRIIRGQQVAVLKPISSFEMLPIDYGLLKKVGEGFSSSTSVCIYKEAARQIVEAG